MFDRDAGVIYRSIRRRQGGPPHPPGGQRRAGLHRRVRPRLAKPAELEVNRSMRPLHLGWILEAWAGREELALSG